MAKTNPWMAGVLIALMLIAILAGTGLVNLPFAVAGAGGVPSAGTGAPTGDLASYCQIPDQDGDNGLGVSIRNIENPSTDFGSNALLVTDLEGNIITSGTATGGTSETFASVTGGIPCGSRGKVYAKSNLTFEGGVADFTSSVPLARVKMESWDSGLPEAYFTSGAYVNITDGADADYYGNNVTSTAQTIGAAGSLDLVLFVKETTATSGFGMNSPDGVGAVVIVDLADNTVISPTGWTMNGPGLVKRDCSDPLVARASTASNGEVCYTLPPIKASTGQMQFPIGIKWTGNPGSSADPVIYIYSRAAFDEGGKIRVDTHNALGTAIGLTPYKATIDVS